MLRVADARDCFGGIRRLLNGRLEKILGPFEHRLVVADGRFTEERAADLQHQIEIIRVAKLEGPAEASHRRFVLAELEQSLTESGERVFVLRLEHGGLLEGLARPRVFFARELRVPNPNMQLHRIRVERESLSKYSQRIIILTVVVQLMRAFIVLFRTQERGGHRQQASSS